MSGRFAVFVRRRQRRVLGYSLLLGIPLNIMVMAQDDFPVFAQLSDMMSYVFAGEGFSEMASRAAYSLESFLLPAMIIFGLATIICLVIAGVAALAVALVIPVRFLAFIDGIVLGVPLFAALHLIGVVDLMTGTFGAFAVVPLMYASVISLGPTVWQKIPFGFSLEDKATRVINVSSQTVRARIVPDGTPDQDFADIAILPGGPVLDTDATLEVNEDSDTVTIIEHHPGAAETVRATTYRIKPVGEGMTRLHIKSALSGLSPLVLWDLWQRPFSEDFADHLEARLTGTKDPSTYGRLTRAVLKKQAKSRQKAQTA